MSTLNSQPFLSKIKLGVVLGLVLVVVVASQTISVGGGGSRQDGPPRVPTVVSSTAQQSQSSSSSSSSSTSTSSSSSSHSNAIIVVAEDDNPSDSSTSPGDDPDSTSPPPSSNVMEDVLFNLPEPDPDVQEALRRRAAIPPEEFEKMLKKVWDRRQKDLADAIASAQTDADLMRKSLAVLLDKDTEPDTIEVVLEDLEFHVSRAINAIDFNAMGGLAAVVPLLNSSHAGIRSNAAWVIGTAVKLDKDLQHAALELGAVPVLVSAVLSEDNPAVLSKFVYALGCLVRFNPRAQRQLALSPNTAAALSRLLSPPATPGPRWDSVRLKTAVLVGDLAFEGAHLEADAETVTGSSIGADGGPAFHSPADLDVDVEVDEAERELRALESISAVLASRDVCDAFLAYLAGGDGSTDDDATRPIEKQLQAFSRVLALCRDQWTTHNPSDVAAVIGSLKRIAVARMDDLGDPDVVAAALREL